MPHHHGRSTTTSKSKKTTSPVRYNPHTSSGTSKSTYVSPEAAKRQKEAVQVAIDKKGAEDLANYKVAQASGVGILPLLANTLTGKKIRQKSFEINRKFFLEKVLTSKNRGDYKNTLESYQSYIKGRQEGTRDAYGRTISKGGNGGPVVEKFVGGRTILAQAPTEAEVSQSDATNAAETKLTKKRIKSRGRKMNIYAQAKDKLILGKKSLLGYV